MERENGKRNNSEKTVKKDKDFDESNNTKAITNQSNLKVFFLNELVKNETNEDTVNNNKHNKQIYQKKIDEIISNIEKEKEEISYEMNEKSSTLQNIILNIEEQTDIYNSIQLKKDNLGKNFNELTTTNHNLLKLIEEKLETFEQIQRMNQSEVKEDEIAKEVGTLEKKFDDMMTNWEEYTSQAKSKIDELKNNLESKKKEYNFKYEKVNSLKKEIDEISSKISVKEELANFLKEEYQKIPIDINRNKFINKISELTHNINNEKNNILVYLNDLKSIENQINLINDNIKKVDNEFEDKLFQDAKKDATSKEFYALFIRIRDGYNMIQKNIIDLNISKTKMKELDSKIDDYQLKLKSYDINQLIEQVELLKKENSLKYKK